MIDITRAMARRQNGSAADTLIEVGPYAAVAATGVVVDHLWGIMDVVGVLAAASWLLYMVSGMLRSLIRAWVNIGFRAVPKALSDQKAIEGLGRGLGVAIAAIALAFIEILAIETTGTEFPLVKPMFVVATIWFVVETAGHVTELHGEIGKWTQKAVSRYAERRNRGPD